MVYDYRLVAGKKKGIKNNFLESISESTQTYQYLLKHQTKGKKRCYCMSLVLEQGGENLNTFQCISYSNFEKKYIGQFYFAVRNVLGMTSS